MPSKHYVRKHMNYSILYPVSKSHSNPTGARQSHGSTDVILSHFKSCGSTTISCKASRKHCNPSHGNSRGSAMEVQYYRA